MTTHHQIFKVFKTLKIFINIELFQQSIFNTDTKKQSLH